MKSFLVAIALLGHGAVLAQESASYKLDEHVFNAGGHPAEGATPASASFEISMDSLGDGLAPGELAGASYRMAGGFLDAHAPPGEVSGLRFDDPTTLSWNGERSVGSYNLYRDAVSSLSGLGFGQCTQQGVPSSSTTDADAPIVGDGFFYLVTAVNRLDEEGTKGARSDGSVRGGVVCP